MYLIFNLTGGKCNWQGDKLDRRKSVSHFWGLGNEIFPPSEWPKVWASTLGVALVLGVLGWLGSELGFHWVMKWYVGPYLVTNAWLVLYTWMQHSHPDVPQLGKEAFSWLRGALSTIDRPYPWLVDHLIGTTHVLHHVNHRVPHYHAVEATEALQACS